MTTKPTSKTSTELPTQAADSRAWVTISGDLDQLTRNSWDAMAAGNDPADLFLHGSEKVRLEVDGEGEPKLAPLSVDRMCHVLCEKIVFVRTKKEGPVPVFPPQELVRNVRMTPNPPLPVLRRLVRAPVFTSDGRLLSAAGFDEPSGILHVPIPGFSVSKFRKEPTPRMVKAARKLLCDELLIDFPFVTDSDRAHALALLLLPFGRDLVDGLAPMHLIEAPTPGTGKGLLVHALTAPALGKPQAVMPEAREEDEWRKRITSTLRTEPGLVVLDNLSRKIDSPSLAALLTTGVWEDRVLGSSDNVRLTVNAVFVATSNNPAFSTEMARRTLRIRIDAAQDRPHLRKVFRHDDLLTWTLENRAPIVRAALVLWQTWLAAGRPLSDAVRGSFESWAQVIGGVLEVAGIPGFLENDQEVYDEADIESAKWRALVRSVWDERRDSWLSASAIVEFAKDTEQFTFRSKAGAPAQMGGWLAQKRHRYFDDLCFESRPGGHRAFEWHLKKRPESGPDGPPDGPQTRDAAKDEPPIPEGSSGTDEWTEEGDLAWARAEHAKVEAAKAERLAKAKTK